MTQIECENIVKMLLLIDDIKSYIAVEEIDYILTNIDFTKPIDFAKKYSEIKNNSLKKKNENSKKS